MILDVDQISIEIHGRAATLHRAQSFRARQKGMLSKVKRKKKPEVRSRELLARVEEDAVFVFCPFPQRARHSPPLQGWDVLEDTLTQLDGMLRDVEANPDAKASEIFRLYHQRSRYVWEMYRKDAIPKECFEWCLREKVADANLIAKWKQAGYEKLCCLRCIQPKDTNFRNTWYG